MIPKKPTPDLIGVGTGFRIKIMLEQFSSGCLLCREAPSFEHHDNRRDLRQLFYRG
jgi:hypothetical protein